MKNTLRTLILAASAVTLPVSIAQAQPTSHSVDRAVVRNIVLVHGAFADGSGWRKVYEDLTNRGYRVTIVQNPLTSFEDDVAATRRALDRQDGPAVLVGHSWGGTVITEAGVHPKVRGLVYVSALSPDAGETTAQQYDGYTTPPEFVIETSGDGFGFIKPENFAAGFAADATKADVDFLAASQVPINMASFGVTLRHAAWRTKPSWAVIATEDKAFDQRMLQDMAKRIGAKVTNVPASHAVYVTRAEVVATVIDDAAQQSGAVSP
ncbi:alpha/beta hydrolase [Azospirillum brasilense]|uniref:Alpha/beta hydrolase n=1 Tax=Azospirillum brasilense TaxID=192 RepID=A0A4D8R2B7_AZOBR|nr:alpha/beta hydrolase [Azospirillum brasilense]QCO15560.1 alpha/beta hydrolase [Azospirillum brasilense]